MYKGPVEWEYLDCERGRLYKVTLPANYDMYDLIALCEEYERRVKTKERSIVE